ncbi:MAG: restriction endonuclease subunit S [Gammaproteobacteria bacterium]|jgi:restriction endonuclease S subunit
MKDLNNIADIIVGYQPKNRIQEKLNGMFCLIQGKNFDECRHLKKETLVTINSERDPKPYLVHKEDILFQARGFKHFAYHFKEGLPNAMVSASFYIVRVKTNEVIPEYLAWWLNQKPAQNYFCAHSSNTAISFISKKALSSLEIQLPSINTQNKICQIAKLQEQESKLKHELIEKRSQLINQLCLNVAQQKENLQ